jgi:hypothetical protein
MCESGIFVGGSLQFCQDTRKDLRFTRKSRDFSVKTQGHIHNHVYKLEGLLAKESGRIRSEESNRSGGGFYKIARHRANLIVTGKGKGLDAKQP